MSFGISVSDFFTVGSLITDIINSLREAGGSKSQYQEILRELEGLERALSYLDKLQSGDTNSTSIASIKYAALSCRRPLEQFLNKIKKYDNALGVWSKAGTIRSTADKLKWVYTQKDEIRKLQIYLNVHVGTINILLAEHGLERIDIVSERSERDKLQLRDRLEDTQKVIEQINRSTQAQAQAVAEANYMLGKLFQMVNSEVVASLKSFARMVSKVW
jgi:tetratricopeptide (TPR) repeat protein